MADKGFLAEVDAEYDTWEKEQSEPKITNQSASSEKIMHKMQNVCTASIPILLLLVFLFGLKFQKKVHSYFSKNGKNEKFGILFLETEFANFRLNDIFIRLFLAITCLVMVFF
jgi:hypothetical protein